jgi:hypothetical protein
MTESARRRDRFGTAWHTRVRSPAIGSKRVEGGPVPTQGGAVTAFGDAADEEAPS